MFVKDNILQQEIFSRNDNIICNKNDSSVNSLVKSVFEYCKSFTQILFKICYEFDNKTNKKFVVKSYRKEDFKF